MRKAAIAAEGRGPSFNVVLSPGRYRVLATAEKTFAGEFSVAAGESLEVVLDRVKVSTRAGRMRRFS